MDNNQFIICRAAAGSGKTYTLVKNYLRIAFSANESQIGERYKRILAITFTNKAANEMKERILNELRNIALLGSGTPMGQDLGEETGLDSTTLQRYAQTVHQSILHNYSDFAVCTIDSFMSRIVHTFAHDLNLPMNFDIHIDNKELIQNAVDSLMSLLGTEGQDDLTQLLCNYAVSRMEDGKSYQIEKTLTELAAKLFDEDTPEYLDTLKNISTAQFDEIEHLMRTDNRHYEQLLKQLGQQAVAYIAEQGLEASDFHGKTYSIGNYFKNIADGKMPEAGKKVLEFVEGDKLGASKCSQETTEAVASAKPRLLEFYRQIRYLQDTEGRRYNTRKIMMANIYQLAVLNKLYEFINSYSADNEIVHISEFNKRISEIVQNEPAPFIYERIGNRYHNYLIDEFQDTSRMQWQNLVPLVDNGVSTGHTSLVVGDGKQAIYRFRQGDVEQFIALPHVDNDLHGRLLESPGVYIHSDLDHNYRTGTAIVEFNNQFFQWVVTTRFADNKLLNDIYIGNGETPALCQQPVKEGGYVQVGFIPKDEELEVLWDEILADIADLTDNKGYAYSDITILARKNKILSQISAHLTAHGVPVVSSESFLLTQSNVVMLIRNVLQYLHSNDDRPAAARVLTYLHRLGITQSAHMEDFIPNVHPIPPIDLDDILAGEGLTFNRHRLSALGLYDCCEEIIRMLNLDGLETAYTATFLGVVARYASKHRQDIAEFLEWFDEHKDKLSSSTADDLDAVRLMTIHKAKGLESPIIIYPIPNERAKQHNIWVQSEPDDNLPLPVSLVVPSKNAHSLYDNVFNDELMKQDMDSINVLYVALTRPKDKLMIYCQTPPESNTTSYNALLSDYMGTRTDATETRPGFLCLGQNSPKKIKENDKQKNDIAEITHISFPSWEGRITIARQDKHLFNSTDDSAVRHGILVHELLSLLPHRDAAEEAMQHFFQHNQLEDSEAEQLRHTLTHALNQPEVARFFDPAYESKNECDLVFRHEVLRPDRIVYTPEEIWVVDFKTGTPKAEHHLQVQRYCEAIAAMPRSTTDQRPVKGHLIYIGTDHCQVIETV